MLDETAEDIGDANTPNTPMWWLKRLSEKQMGRLPKLQNLDRYYEGDQPLQFASEKYRSAFGGLFRELADNWCESVVNATEEKLNVVGFRFGPTADADQEAWRIWQANGLDLESQVAHIEALVLSECYGLVWPNINDPDTPLITVEHPTQMVTWPKANNRREVAAAMKRYVDDDGYEIAYLYLPELVYRFRSTTKSKSGLREFTIGRWVLEDRDDAPDPGVQPNPLAPVVPVVPIQNRPRLVKPPRSEIENVIPLQDAVNKLWCDMLLDSEFSAYTQRYVLGWEPDVDPDTNQPIAPPWKQQDRLWFFPPADDGESQMSVGTFPAADLAGFLKAIELCVNHIASQTRTPPHYLSPSADRLSGESIKASESGLIAKVRRRMVPFGEAWEQMLRLCFRLKGDQERANFEGAETIWLDPEQATEGELTDAAQKLRAMGIPLEFVLEFLRKTPTEIQRIMTAVAAEALLAPEPPPPEPVPV